MILTNTKVKMHKNIWFNKLPISAHMFCVWIWFLFYFHSFCITVFAHSKMANAITRFTFVLLPAVEWTISVYRLAAVVVFWLFLFSYFQIRSIFYLLLWHFWSSEDIHSANHCYSYCYNSFAVKSLLAIIAGL